MICLRLMKTTCYVLFTALLVPFPPVAAAEGDILFKAKCAPCHGKHGEGKASAKAPSLVSPKVKGMSDDEIRDLVASRANGEQEKRPMHTLQKKRLTADQIDAIVAHIRELQKKSN